MCIRITLQSISVSGKTLDLLSNKYEQILLTGDFNNEKYDKPMDGFCNIYNLCTLIKVPACY